MRRLRGDKARVERKGRVGWFLDMRRGTGQDRGLGGVKQGKHTRANSKNGEDWECWSKILIVCDFIFACKDFTYNCGALSYLGKVSKNTKELKIILRDTGQSKTMSGRGKCATPKDGLDGVRRE